MDVDLYQREADLTQDLLDLTDKIPETWRELAEAETEYDTVTTAAFVYYTEQMGLSAAAAKERLKGDAQVIEAKKRKIMAEGMQKYNVEAINTAKLVIKATEAQIQRAMASPNVGIGAF